MARLRVFIASSSEAEAVAKAARLQLLQELGESVEVRPWSKTFELSDTFMESLEKEIEQADFAVLVLTPDDITASRGRRKKAPRDNLVFELGLFMGRLGRKRCYLLRQKGHDLKLPTDLLGVESAAFTPPADGDWKTALGATCARIGESIARLGARPKLSAEAVIAQAAVRGFLERVKGAWWERVTALRGRSISFFQIEPDEIFNSVRLAGRYYNSRGVCVGNWASVLARIVPDERKILYLWGGRHHANPREPLHGFAQVELEGSADAAETIHRGSGKFWDINEAHPEKTVLKPFEVRRIAGQEDIATMTSGKEKAVRALVTRTLHEW